MYPRHMSREAKRLEGLIAELAPVRDEQLVGALSSPDAAALFSAILDAPVPIRVDERIRPRRRRVLAFAVAAVVAAVLSLPALGVGEKIGRIFGGWRSEPDYPAPVPSASDVVIASGEDGVGWKLVATRSDQGLCLGLVYTSSRREEVGEAGCGYRDLRGDLDPEIRGDPSTKCLASPTEIVPCGSLPRRWIDFPHETDPSPYFTGAGSELTRIIVFGVAAADVDNVELVLTNGRTVSANIVGEPEGLGAPLNFYWATLPLDDGYRRSLELTQLLEMVVARDAEGRILERRVPAWNGNPTGDPDGPPPPSLDGA
jgi:hypothetical protein